MTMISKWNACFDSANSQVAFNPSTNISHCYAWWKSDSGITLSGSFVTQWTDVVNGRVLTSSGSLTPWFSASVNAANGRPTVAFDGNKKMFSNETTANWGFLHNTANTGSSVAMCFKKNVGSLQCVYTTTTIGIGPAYPGRMFASSYTTGVDATLVATNVNGPSWYGRNPGIVSGSVMYFIEALSGSNFYSRSSGNTFQARASGLTATTATTSSVPFMLGNVDGSTWPLKSDLCELIIYNKTLSEAEMAQLGNYFAQKYGATP